MKKRLLFILIPIIALAAVIVYFLFSGTKETDLLSKVPKYAKSVLVIDIKGLSTKLLVDELTSDEKSAGKLAEMLPDSLPDIDFTNSGINLLDKAALFTIEFNQDIWVNLLLPLSDYQTFINFKDSLVATGDFTQRTNGDFLVSEKYKLTVNWNNNFVHISNCTFYPINSINGLIETLNLAPKMSILTDSVFTSKLSGDYDFFLYSTPYENHPKKTAQLISSNFAKSFSYIRFYDGELVINTEIELKKGSLADSVFKDKKNPVKAIQPNDSTGLTASLNINAESFFKFLEQFSSVKFDKDKIPLLMAWSGSASFALNSSQLIENEFISYEFDDNFNKVEVRKVTKEKVTDLQANLGIDKAVIDKVLSDKKIYKEGKDTLLFKGAGFVVKDKAESFLCYNRHLNQPQLADRTNDASVTMWLDYKKFLPILNDYRVQTDSLWLNRFDIENIELEVNKPENLQVNLKVSFKNKDKNAFFNIAEKIE